MAFPFELEPVDGLLSRLRSENDLSNVPIRRLGSDSENDGYHTFRWLWNNRSERFTRRMLMYATATDQETWQVLCKHTLGAKACCLSIGNDRWSSHSHGNEQKTNDTHARIDRQMTKIFNLSSSRDWIAIVYGSFHLSLTSVTIVVRSKAKTTTTTTTAIKRIESNGQNNKTSDANVIGCIYALINSPPSLIRRWTICFFVVSGCPHHHHLYIHRLWSIFSPHAHFSRPTITTYRPHTSFTAE